MKIVDCFPYFNEKELLELRINLMYDYVDKFIITEANHTHGGYPKKYTLQTVIDEIGLPKDKIQIVHVSLPNFFQSNDNWERERFQRNVAANFFEDDAIYHVSDCDEIIDPEKLKFFIQAVIDNPDRIIRVPLIYLNCRADLIVTDKSGKKRTWNTSFFCRKQHVKKYTLSDIRESYAMNKFNVEYQDLFPIDQNGNTIDSGWHFSWMGDKNRIKLKSFSFLHCYDSNTDIFSKCVAPIYSKEFQDFLDKYIPEEGSTDPYGRDDHILKKYPKELLPKKIFELPRVEKFLFQT